MFTVDTAPLSRSLQGMQRFAEKVRREAFKRLGAKVKEQTRARITTTKKGPDGQRWKAWSDAYAATRTKRHSLLYATGLMLRTISVRSSADGITIGSPRTYAAAVQAERPFLGIGPRDVPVLDRMLGSWAAQEMKRRVRQ